MEKKITIMILGSTKSKGRQISFSKTVLLCATLLFIGFFVTLGTFINDYLIMKSSITDYNQLINIKANQDRVVDMQVHNIREFGGEINELKKKLADLDDFEKRIRNVANLGISSGHEMLIGVGGSPGDDDMEQPLPKKP